VIRILKQLGYGSLYLAIIMVFVVGIYSVTVREDPTCFDNIQNQSEEGVDCGGDCVSCVLKNAKLEIRQSTFIPAGADRITVLAVVRNPTETGAFFSYKIDVESNFGGTLTFFMVLAEALTIFSSSSISKAVIFTVSSISSD